ncbi:MAG: VIT domain-containing protein [Myxococcales bacterium]
MRAQRWQWAWVTGLLWLGSACQNKDAASDDNTLQGPTQATLGWRTTPELVESAPISLTASDGSGLVLASLSARAVIEEPLAFTELHLVFHNPEARQREGRFAITLPKAAAISRFAMRVGSEWQEGEVVERKRAQAVYEDYLHRKEDPALLERDAGNQFTARVFPIEANADKEIIVAYSEELPNSSEPYRLLLKGLSRLNELKVDVLFGSGSSTGLESSERAREPGQRLTLQEQNHVPSADLAVELPRARSQLALRSGDLVVARVSPAPKLPAEGVDGLSVLFDTSASRALGFEAQIERLGALLSVLQARGKTDFPLRVLAFDQTLEEIYAGPVSGFSVRDKGRLLARDALGASNLSAALSALSQGQNQTSRVLVVSDGVVTAGVDDTTTMREAVAQLAAHGVQRVDALAEGGIRDESVLAALTRAGLKHTGVVLDSRLSVDSLADKLLKATQERVEVNVPGASWVYPRVLEGVQAGDEYLVFAELEAKATLRIELGALGSVSPKVMEAPRPLLERACARAKIASLEGSLHALRAEETADRARLSREIVALSTKQRVLSEFTALLVLENAGEYARFGLDPTALANILRVNEQGLELFDRKSAQPSEVAVAEGRAPSSESLTDEVLRGMSRLGGSARPAAEPSGQAAPASPRAEQPASGAQPSFAAPTPMPSGALVEKRADLDSARSKLEAKADDAPPKPARRPEAPREARDHEASAARADEAEAAAEALLLGALGADKAKSSAAPAAPPATAAPMPAPPAAVARSRAAEGKGSSGVGSLGALGTGAGGGGSVSEAAPSIMGRINPLTGEPEFLPGAYNRLPAGPLEARAVARLHTASGLDSALAAKVVRGNLSSLARGCYARANERANVPEQVNLEFTLSDKGTVRSVFVSRGSLRDRQVERCILAGAQGLQFPKPELANASVEAGVELSMAEATPRSTPTPGGAPVVRAAPKIKHPEIGDAYEGVLASTLEALKRHDLQGARSLADAAHAQNPGDVIGLIALGEALEAQGDFARAARAYGSLIDLFPSRTDLRRMAGARLERLPQEHGLALATDSFEKALAQRPDHPSSHRLLAYAQLKQGDHAGAFATLAGALARSFPWARFEGVERILREDLGLVAAAWIRTHPDRTQDVLADLARLGVELDQKPSLRFVLNWETDANDVDFHIYDGRGGHAYYLQPKLGSGGSLYADITSGYGPECFAIAGKARAYPYVLQAHYFSRGPMGYGMGKLEVIEHDGMGGLRFVEQPFAIMKDKAFVELAVLETPQASQGLPGGAVSLGTH